MKNKRYRECWDEVQGSRGKKEECFCASFLWTVTKPRAGFNCLKEFRTRTLQDEDERGSSVETTGE